MYHLVDLLDLRDLGDEDEATPVAIAFTWRGLPYRSSTPWSTRTGQRIAGRREVISQPAKPGLSQVVDQALKICWVLSP